MGAFSSSCSPVLVTARLVKQDIHASLPLLWCGSCVRAVRVLPQYPGSRMLLPLMFLVLHPFSILLFFHFADAANPRPCWPWLLLLAGSPWCWGGSGSSQPVLGGWCLWPECLRFPPCVSLGGNILLSHLLAIVQLAGTLFREGDATSRARREGTDHLGVPKSCVGFLCRCVSNGIRSE